MFTITAALAFLVYVLAGLFLLGGLLLAAFLGIVVLSVARDELRKSTMVIVSTGKSPGVVREPEL